MGYSGFRGPVLHSPGKVGWSVGHSVALHLGGCGYEGQTHVAAEAAALTCFGFDVLPQEVAAGDVLEAKVVGDPLADRALAGARGTQDDGTQELGSHGVGESTDSGSLQQELTHTAPHQRSFLASLAPHHIRDNMCSVYSRNEQIKGALGGQTDKQLSRDTEKRTIQKFNLEEKKKKSRIKNTHTLYHADEGRREGNTALLLCWFQLRRTGSNMSS